MPPEFSHQQKRKLRTDARVHIWDNPLLFKRRVDQIIRRCVPEAKQGEVLNKCHASPYEGHFLGDRIAQKILQLSFYWLTLFRDYYEWVMHCDRCQRMGNINRRNEMSLQGILVV